MFRLLYLDPEANKEQYDVDIGGQKYEGMDDEDKRWVNVLPGTAIFKRSIWATISLINHTVLYFGTIHE